MSKESDLIHAAASALGRLGGNTVTQKKIDHLTAISAAGVAARLKKLKEKKQAMKQTTKSR